MYFHIVILISNNFNNETRDKEGDFIENFLTRIIFSLLLLLFKVYKSIE